MKKVRTSSLLKRILWLTNGALVVACLLVWIVGVTTAPKWIHSNFQIGQSLWLTDVALLPGVTNFSWTVWKSNEFDKEDWEAIRGMETAYTPGCCVGQENDEHRSFFDLYWWPAIDYECYGGETHNLTIAVWLPTLAFAVPLAISYIQRRRRTNRGCCLVCGYDLRGTPGEKCSECGTAIVREQHNQII